MVCFFFIAIASVVIVSKPQLVIPTRANTSACLRYAIMCERNLNASPLPKGVLCRRNRDPEGHRENVIAIYHFPISRSILFSPDKTDRNLSGQISNRVTLFADLYLWNFHSDTSIRRLNHVEHEFLAISPRKNYQELRKISFM